MIMNFSLYKLFSKSKKGKVRDLGMSPPNYLKKKEKKVLKKSLIKKKLGDESLNP